MITNVAYNRRQPLVSKSSHIYASTDRRQSLQYLNNTIKSTNIGNHTSPVVSFDVYGNRYETKVVQRTLDIKI